MINHFSHEGEHHDAAGDATCPVCRARVDSATAPSRTFDGATWLFCDDRCLRAFLKRPDYYAARARAEGLRGAGDASH
jgi:YHS domain-containing protein